MTDPQLDRAFAELRKGSQASLFLMLVGVLFLLGSVYYAATRLRPLEQQVAQKKADVERLAAEEAAAKQRVAALQRDYTTLKASTEQLYAVRVTPGNQVYELKATAQATGKTTGDRSQYRFSIYVNSPVQTLGSIKSVEYRFNHPTFDQKLLVATDADNQFMVGYVGWGCLNRVDVTVTLKDGAEHGFDFDMCRSLGPQWGDSDRFQGKEASVNKQATVSQLEQIAHLVKKMKLRRDMVTPPHPPSPASADSTSPPSNQVDKHPDPPNDY